MFGPLGTFDRMPRGRAHGGPRGQRGGGRIRGQHARGQGHLRAPGLHGRGFGPRAKEGWAGVRARLPGQAQQQGRRDGRGQQRQVAPSAAPGGPAHGQGAPGHPHAFQQPPLHRGGQQHEPRADGHPGQQRPRDRGPLAMERAPSRHHPRQPGAVGQRQGQRRHQAHVVLRVPGLHHRVGQAGVEQRPPHQRPAQRGHGQGQDLCARVRGAALEHQSPQAQQG